MHDVTDEELSLSGYCARREDVWLSGLFWFIWWSSVVMAEVRSFLSHNVWHSMFWSQRWCLSCKNSFKWAWHFGALRAFSPVPLSSCTCLFDMTIIILLFSTHMGSSALGWQTCLPTILIILLKLSVSKKPVCATWSWFHSLETDWVYIRQKW